MATPDQIRAVCQQPHLVYHHELYQPGDPRRAPEWTGKCLVDFRGTWSECFDWIAAQPSPHPAYYLRPDRAATAGSLRDQLLASIALD